MIVRLRQIADDLRFGWSLIPAACCVGAVILALILLEVDAALGADYWPTRLQASADNARAILSTVAGGLISAVTLLLSLALVAVQLGSSQFSPRTISNWLGDRVLQVAIGFVLGTVVFCLVTLQASDTIDGAALEIPHRAVFVSLILTVVSLFTVVRSVDHLAKSLRIGTVAQTILAETLALIEDTDDRNRPALPLGPPHSEQDRTGTPIESTKAGWIQQVDRMRLLAVCPEAATIRVTKPVGTFVLDRAPLAFMECGDDLDGNVDAALVDNIVDAFAIGPTRTTQEDVSFGLLRLTDIAMRALSPGVNDPNTAIDVLNYVATILLSLMSRDEPAQRIEKDGRVIVLPSHTHAEYVDMSVSPIRRAASHDPRVMVSIARLCEQVSSEVHRRGLPGSPEIFGPTLDALEADVEAGDAIEPDRQWILSAIGDARSVVSGSE